MSLDLEAIHAQLPPPTRTVRLVVSDMDGTILTPDKTLSPATLSAASRLSEAGIGLCLASARSPDLMLPYVGQLGLDTDSAGFNGGCVFGADGRPILNRVFSPDVVAIICDMLHVHGVETWLVRGNEWLVRTGGTPFVERERRVVGGTPLPVGDFRAHYDGVNKVVAVGNNYSLLESLETEIGAMLRGTVSAHRSQENLLGITPSLANKGEALRELAARSGVAVEHVACLGDSYNDLPMFSVAGLRVAMAQAPEAVQAGAHYVTSSNADDGWARAITQFILPRAPQSGDKIS